MDTGSKVQPHHHGVQSLKAQLGNGNQLQIHTFICSEPVIVDVDSGNEWVQLLVYATKGTVKLVCSCCWDILGV